jgi:hypothetical protein
MSATCIFVPLHCGLPRGRPEAARQISRDECTCDRLAVAYTRSA